MSSVPSVDPLPAVAPTTPAALDRSLVHGVAWLGGVKWTVQIVTWVITIAVARMLAPQDYGLFSMAAVLLAFITLVGESGIGTTVITVREITPAQVAQINGGAVLLGVLSFAIACLAAVPVGWFYGAVPLPRVIMVMSLTLVIVAFRIVPSALLQRELRFSRLAIIEGVQGLIQGVATLLFAVAGFRYWSLVFGALIGTAVGTLATLAAMRYPLRFPRWETLRPVLPFTREVLVARVCWYVYANADFVVAGKRLGALALGAYSYAWTLASIPVDKITTLLGGVTPSVFARVQHDRAALRRFFLTITEGLALIAFPLTIGLAAVARDFVGVVFEPPWRPMILPLQVLALYASVRTITPTAAHVLTAAGDTRFQMYQSAIAAIGLPIAFYVGSRWGTLGIALAWAVAHPVLIYFPLNARVFWRLEIPVFHYLRALWPALSACFLMVAAVALARYTVSLTYGRPVRLAAETVFGAVAYSLSLLVLHRARVRRFLQLWRPGGIQDTGVNAGAPATSADPHRLQSRG